MPVRKHIINVHTGTGTDAPTGTTNASGDTSGNISTQTVDYDESGNSAVTSYVVDTTENPSGEKTYNGDGTNTEYYAFDLTRGFVLHVSFTMDFNFVRQVQTNILSLEHSLQLEAIQTQTCQDVQ